MEQYNLVKNTLDQIPQPSANAKHIVGLVKESGRKQDISKLLNEEIEKNSVLEFIRKPTEIFVAEKEKLERQPESDR